MKTLACVPFMVAQDRWKQKKNAGGEGNES